MRVVYPSEDVHKPWNLVEDESLNGQLDVYVKPMLKGKDLKGMAVGSGKDCFITSDCYRRDCPQSLVDL